VIRAWKKNNCPIYKYKYTIYRIFEQEKSEENLKKRGNSEISTKNFCRRDGKVRYLQMNAGRDHKRERVYFTEKHTYL